MKVDKFGNLITNIGELDAPGLFSVSPPAVNSHRRSDRDSICRSYAEGRESEFFAIVGSSGYLEIAARQSSAADKLGAEIGTPVGLMIDPTK